MVPSPITRPLDGAELQRLAEALTRPLPEIPARYFYDDRGAALFDAITQQPEYYQTRTEIEILRTSADEIIAASGASELVELGSGAGIKIVLLLNAQQRAGKLRRCVMFDINQGWLDASAAKLKARYPDLELGLVHGDFTHELRQLGRAPGRLVLLLAGTFGNLHPKDGPALLRQIRHCLHDDGALLLGVDLEKDPAVLEAAYNDRAGVTARFNRNILAALNHRFDGSFKPQDFDHLAFYDQDQAWIEMRLQARVQTHAEVPQIGFSRDFAPGEQIRTELSCKYSRPRIAAMAALAGLELTQWYTDKDQLFGLALLTPQPQG
ncbi:MAG: L-histidine N(alpha)-methyltransferase [Oligoflexia bacterium]|nr:L-histidine N(alpha)-methyltransferase [Oligoflexia bacterium]